MDIVTSKVSGVNRVKSSCYPRPAAFSSEFCSTCVQKHFKLGLCNVSCNDRKLYVQSQSNLLTNGRSRQMLHILVYMSVTIISHA